MFYIILYTDVSDHASVCFWFVMRPFVTLVHHETIQRSGSLEFGEHVCLAEDEIRLRKHVYLYFKMLLIDKFSMLNPSSNLSSCDFWHVWIQQRSCCELLLFLCECDQFFSCNTGQLQHWTVYKIYKMKLTNWDCKLDRAAVSSSLKRVLVQLWQVTLVSATVQGSVRNATIKKRSCKNELL